MRAAANTITASLPSMPGLRPVPLVAPTFGFFMSHSIHLQKRLSLAIAAALHGVAPMALAQAQDAQETQTAASDASAKTLDKITVAVTRYNAADMQMAATNTANVLSA